MRVRPLNEREKALKTEDIVTVQNQQLVLTNPSQPDDERQYAFNHCFDSRNRYGDEYASQEDVFAAIGSPLVDQVWKGFNTCILAYGQTGSGKSYSMTGSSKDPAQRGLIPRIMGDIFERIERDVGDENTLYSVQVSFLEIYMERIRDLLSYQESSEEVLDGREAKRQGEESLKIRESPTLGVFVEGLSRVRVFSYGDVEALMEAGNRVRTTAATKMNASSSRSHAVFTVSFTKTVKDMESLSAKDSSSAIHLVDLAGSERQKKTKARGQALKEGAMINQSLSSLGEVISKLADRAVAAAKFAARFPDRTYKPKGMIPYRNSKLTRVLQQSLGGNSKTVMLAAISPSSDNHTETLSTLRYASRASKIRNVPVVNESPNEALIRALREEVRRLKDELKAALGSELAPSGGNDEGGAAAVSEEAKKAKSELLELRKQLDRQRQTIEELNMTVEERAAHVAALKAEQESRLAESGLFRRPRHSRTSVNHLVNLNEDELMTEQLAYFIPRGEALRVGPFRSSSCELQLGGALIQDPHAVLVTKAEADTTILTPQPGADVYVNGSLVAGRDPVVLHHGDIVVFGANHAFRFVSPKTIGKTPVGGGSSNGGEDGAPHDYVYALRQMAAQNVNLSRHFAKDDDGERERLVLENILMRAHPQILEANAMAVALHKPVRFELVVARDVSQSHASRDAVARIRVHHVDEDRESLWSYGKFVDRVAAMSTLYEHFASGAAVAYRGEESDDLNRTNESAVISMLGTVVDSGDVVVDPFFDPPDDELIGVAHVFLDCVLDGLEIHLDATPVLNDEGVVVGTLAVTITPFSAQGEREPQPTGDWCTVGSTLSLCVEIHSAMGIPEENSEGVYVQYATLGPRGPSKTAITHTARAPGPTDGGVHVLDFTRTHPIRRIKPEFMVWLESGDLALQVFGRLPAHLYQTARHHALTSVVVPSLPDHVLASNRAILPLLPPPSLTPGSSGGGGGGGVGGGGGGEEMVEEEEDEVVVEEVVVEGEKKSRTCRIQ